MHEYLHIIYALRWIDHEQRVLSVHASQNNNTITLYHLDVNF